MWRADGARARDRSFFDKVPKTDLERLSREVPPGFCSARATDGGLRCPSDKGVPEQACPTYMGGSARGIL